MWFLRLKMTRWLACLGLCCGLWVAVTATSAPGQRPRRDGALKTTAAKEPSSPVRGLGHVGERQLDSCQQIDRPDDDKEKRSDARRDGRGPGGQHAGGAGHIERRFIYDAVRRAGGPLELLPLLYIPEVRRELQLDEQVFKTKLDAYMLEMQKRADENRKQAAGQSKSLLGELFKEHLRLENERFQKFLDELTPTQQDQLIYLFVQARNYRSLSNQLVDEKMGMTPEEASNIRQEIEEIREQTMDETRDRFRRIFDQGGGREQFEKIVRENQGKMDARIERKLTDAQREKFAELRGKTLGAPPEWLVRGMEFPFRPGPPPRSSPRGQPTSKENPAADSQGD
jgi:hypothetical protein